MGLIELPDNRLNARPPVSGTEMVQSGVQKVQESDFQALPHGKWMELVRLVIPAPRQAPKKHAMP